MTESHSAEAPRVYRVAPIRGNGHWQRVQYLTAMDEVTPVQYSRYAESHPGPGAHPLYLVNIPGYGVLGLRSSQAEHFIAGICAGLLFNGSYRIDALFQLINRSPGTPVRHWSLTGSVNLYVRPEQHAVFTVAYQVALGFSKTATDREAVTDLLMSLLTVEKGRD